MRKPVLLFLSSMLVLFSFSFCTATKKEDKSEAKTPNIIYILADDLGYGDVSCYNEDSKIITPNIDKLASQGVLFTDAHTSSAVCTPTRYGTITGRYNWRSTLKRGVLKGYSKALIPQERKTIAGLLKENGYLTAGIGKWHLGWNWANVDAGNENIDYSNPVENSPTTLGFDYFYGFCGSLDMAPYVWIENDMPTMVPTKETVNKEKQAWWRKGPTSDDFDHEQVLPHITDKTVTFINENANKGKPFFIYMPLPAPHTPILPTEEFKGKSGLDNPYGDFVIMVDAMLGRVMNALEEQGVAENTILVFTSDNGCSNQADYEQLATKGHDPSYVYRGHKADIFEGGHRVPYIVSWPNKVKSGKSNQLVCSTDFTATVADALGFKYGDEVAEDSYSYLSALNVESTSETRESIIHHSVNGSFAIREGDWKLCVCPGSAGWSYPRPQDIIKEQLDLPPMQLYNLKEDIGETNNLLAENPEKAEELKAMLKKIILDGRSTTGVPQENEGMDAWPQIETIVN